MGREEVGEFQTSPTPEPPAPREATEKATGTDGHSPPPRAEKSAQRPNLRVVDPIQLPIKTRLQAIRQDRNLGLEPEKRWAKAGQLIEYGVDDDTLCDWYRNYLATEKKGSKAFAQCDPPWPIEYFLDKADSFRAPPGQAHQQVKHGKAQVLANEF